MIFRFILSHEILGSKEISEPIGWLQTKLTIERHKDFGSLVEYFNGTFTFYGNDGENDGGIDFIRQVEKTYGVDAYLGITIEVAPDNYVFENVFIGQLDLSTINEITDNKAEIAIIRDDFWAKFINRYETPVNIQSDESLDGDPVAVFEHVNLKLLSQKIRVKGDYFEEIGTAIGRHVVNSGDYIQIGFNEARINEVLQKYNIPTAQNPQLPVSIIIPEFDGVYNFDIDISVSNFVATWVVASPAFTDYRPISNSLLFYYKIGEEPEIDIPFVDVGTYGNFPIVGNGGTRYHAIVPNVVLKAGQPFKVFAKVLNDDWEFEEVDLPSPATRIRGNSILVWGENNHSVVTYIQNTSIPYDDYDHGDVPPDLTPSTMKIVGDTTYLTTDANSFFIHDVGGQICDRITSQDESFYSELLGSDKTKYRQYDENGCRWANVLIQGLQVRQYNLIEKPYSLSIKKWFDGINPITPLALMYDEIEGSQVIRVEEREFSFDATDTSVDLNFVRNIVRRYDPDLLYKTVKTGFKKWESENISGIDDVQTKHTYATQLKRTGKDIALESELIAASLALENTRRTTREKSADYKFDNDSFIVSINPNPQTVSPDLSPDIDDYIPELDENFTSITGLLNPETRYNSRYTPARSLLRWLKFLSGSLFQYVNSPFKFTYGEGNYAMESTLIDPCEPNPETLAENQDIISVNPVHLPFEYEFTDVPLDYDEYRLIADNRTKAIGISQTDENHTKFFIKKLEYDIVQGQANISAWPTSWMDIMVIEGEFALKDCNPDVLPEGCYRITEDGDFRITESGDYRILEDC